MKKQQAAQSEADNQFSKIGIGKHGLGLGQVKDSAQLNDFGVRRKAMNVI
ncbi:hypothetical protein MRBBS_0056 [Marinobacter sp. BSs20148]|nr:hypothetical protein MRBBS_0056 [Marinobacter sp. BSs20148]